VANSVVIPVIIDDKGGVTLGKIAQGLDNVGKKAKEAQGFMSEFSKSLSSGVGLGAGFTLGAAAANKMLEVVRSIPAEFSRLVEAASKISDLAARSGVATDALQELQYAGSLVGVSLESAAAGITKMQRALVDTPEKFETHRMELATHVWTAMKETDSRECRNCHSWDAMDPHKQSGRASKKMAQAQKEGKTCIDCHKGIAHSLPPIEQHIGAPKVAATEEGQVAASR